MSNARELDAVIRAVEAGTQVDPSCQVLVPIDTRTGQPARPGVFSLGRKGWKHLLVTNSNKAGVVAVRRNLTIAVEDFSRGWRFDLLVDYEARCNPGREVRVAQALWSGESPQERLETLLRGWVLQRLDGGVADFVRDFESAAGSLAEDLRARALEQTGLTLAVRVHLPDAGRVDPLRIGPLTLPIHLQDYDTEVSLGFEVELAVEPGKERIAFLHREHGADLEREVREQVREHFLTSVTLQRFHVELTDAVQKDLWRELNAIVRPYGRRVMRLSLQGEALPGGVESRWLKLTHEFKQWLRNYPKEVEVKTELLLHLKDLGRFVRSKVPNLKEWANHEVEDATTQALFGITYTDLCLSFDEKMAAIERTMREKADAIGYELRQLVTITDLQFDILRRPFPVQLRGEFPTRLARLKVQLEVNASLIISRPSEIASLLNRNVDVPDQIRDVLRDRVQQILHHVEPERFYMEFQTAREEGSQSVQDQLEAVIRQTVAGEFHGEVLSLSCKQLETEFSGRLERLMTPRHDFSVQVELSSGGPSVPYEGSFRVTGVDESGWIFFQTSSPEPEALIACAERELRYRLSDGTALHLLQTSNTDQKKEVDTWLQDRLQQEFGLRVRVLDWRRKPLEVQTEIANEQLRLMADTIREQHSRVDLAATMRQGHVLIETKAAENRVEQIHKLQERLTRITVAGDAPEEEKDLRDKITRLKEEQKRALAEAAEDRSRLTLPQLGSAWGVLTERGEGATSRAGESRTEEPAAESKASDKQAGN